MTDAVDDDDAVPPFAREVRERSVARIRALRLPVNPALPFVDAPLVRSTEEVVARMLALYAVVARTYGAPREMAEGWLEQEGLTGELTPLEADLVAGINQLPWQGRVECLWAFAWALGHHDHLDPTRLCADDFVQMFPDMRVGESSAEFRARSRLRPDADLYEEADFHYLLTWAAREVALHSPGASPVEGPAVFERRRALDWIVEADTDWDEITLDT